MSALLRTSAAVLGGALLLVATAASAETLLFRFSKASAAKQWATFNEAWVVQNGAYRADPIWWTWAVGWYFGPKAYKNIRAEFVIVDLPEFTSIGGFIRAKFKGDTFSGYFVEFVKTDEDQGIGTVKLMKYVNFDPVTLDRIETTLCSGSIDVGAKSRVAIEAQGTELRALYNGDVVCAANDGTFKKGTVGIFAETNPEVATQPGFQSIKLVTP